MNNELLNDLIGTLETLASPEQPSREELIEALLRCERAVGCMNPKILSIGAGKMAELNASAESARALLARCDNKA